MREEVRIMNPGGAVYAPRVATSMSSRISTLIQMRRLHKLAFGPAVATRWHRLVATTERYVLLSGAGTVEVGDLPAQNVAPSDMFDSAWLPPAD